MSLFRTSILAALSVIVALTGAGALAACGDGGDAASPSASPDPVVLRVDGRPIRQSAIDALRAEFRLGGTEDTEARALEEAVRREVVRREAERLEVGADAGEVTARRARLVSQLGGEEALTAALAKVPITDAQLRSGLRDGVLREAVQDAKYGSLVATDAQARAYYDENRASFRREASAHLEMIQVRAERIGESALRRLGEGRPFDEVARQFSTDPESKAAGGDMGTVTLASLPAVLRRAVFAARPGEVTGPVEGPGGWYLIRVSELQRAGVAPFADVRPDILEELTRSRRYEALEAWLDAAREKASVERF
ncbi:MAG TPA: peptidyl-prolyl cis-trans isomerase [Thermoleophilia bacterium]|nr:peptidyl-prolyl cis-trans isomerase [Thermoleophilia bacterium]